VLKIQIGSHWHKVRDWSLASWVNVLMFSPRFSVVCHQGWSLCERRKDVSSLCHNVKGVHDILAINSLIFLEETILKVTNFSDMQNSREEVGINSRLGPCSEILRVYKERPPVYTL
jgi:hypothetical protein